MLNGIVRNLRKGYAVNYTDIKGNEKKIISSLQNETTNRYALHKDGNFVRLTILGYGVDNPGICICNGYNLKN